MHPETLASETRRVLEKIGKQPFLSDFYLAGGTALALHLGHRESIDLDFFSEYDFSLEKLRKEMSELGRYVLVNEEPGTLDGMLENVKVTFLRYQYPLLFPLVPFLNIRIADERDIACMKIDAISSRGSKKDFVDLYFLLEKYSLADILELFHRKYSQVEYNRLHLLKSLSFFDDAGLDAMPKMLINRDWEFVKEKILQSVKQLV